MPQLTSSRTHAWLLGLVFWLSGALALVYEVAWGKSLGLALGSTGLAQALVLATFLGGLAIGNAWLGPWADRSADPLKRYALLELAIAALAAASPFVLQALPELFAVLARWGWPAEIRWTVKAAVAALVLLPPTILMGGTLPALGRYVTGSLAGVGRSIAGLYALNSLGGATGALAAGFWLLPALGLDGAVWAAAAANALVAAAAFALARRHVPAPGPEPVEAADAPTSDRDVKVAMATAAIGGFVSLACETAWIRVLSLVLGSSAYSFSLMLAAFVAGIALGSHLIRRGVLATWTPLAQLAAAQLAAAAGILVTLPLVERLPFWFLALGNVFARTPEAWAWHEGLKFAVCFGLMLAPTIGFGMALPVACRVATRSLSTVGGSVGRVFSANAIGCVTGSLAAGLVLMPAVGLQNLLVGSAIAMALTGLLVALRAGGARPRLALAAVPLLAAVAYRAFAPAWDTGLLIAGVFRAHGPEAHVTEAEFRRMQARWRVLYHRDDVSATVTVADDGRMRALRVNGKADASTGADMVTQLLCGHLPLLLHPKAEDVLVVGMGSGVTANAALTHPMRSVEVVELLGSVVDAASHFGAHNGYVLTNDRLRLHVDDALSHLRETPRTYDVIINEPSNPWMAGVGNLFTSEFYRDAKQRLRPGGLMVQWVQTYEMDDATFRLVLRTFTSAFPHATLWRGNDGDLLLVGAMTPVAVDAAAIAARLALRGVREDLGRAGIRRVATLLSTQLLSAEKLQGLAGPGPLNTLRRPRLEYEAPRALYLDAAVRTPYLADERVAPTASRLALAGYLAGRGGVLSREDYAELVQYHANVDSRDPVVGRYLAEWRRAHPADPLAALAAARLNRSFGRLDAARAELTPWLAAHPKDGRLLEEAVALELDWLQAKQGQLIDGPAAFARLDGLMRRLVASKPDQAGWAHRRLAGAYLAYEQLDRGVSHLALADVAAAAEGRGAETAPERVGLWLHAAKLASAASQPEAAAECARRVLLIAPEQADAKALLAALERAGAR